MKYSVYDLHCDLLGCVEDNDSGYGFDSPEINCSMPQLEAGGVDFQVFAVAAVTLPGSTKKAENQIELYRELKPRLTKVKGCIAFENASVLAEEDEPLEKAFERFDRFTSVEKAAYVSLTWNCENRFGGGNATKIGLKEDGKELLRYISGRGVAVDFSHTSDWLADDILNLIDHEGLDLRVMASHSNFREVSDINRNLPDRLAKELIKRGAIIGLNFVRRFVGEKPEDFIRHIEKGLELGGENALALGADFYGGINIPPHLMKMVTFPTFFPEFPNASAYPQFFEMLEKHFPPELLKKIAGGNAKNYLSRSFQQTA